VLAEQHRIVTKVNELLTLCEQLKTKLATAQTLQQQLAETLVQQAVA
jgi:type I restriction enzyme S subunit